MFETSGLQMYSTESVMRVSVGESEHVLAQSNVWEIRNEKQMAALKIERGREGGGKSDDEPKYNIYHLFCLCARPLNYDYFIHPGTERKEEGGRAEDKKRIYNYLCIAVNFIFQNF